MDSSSDFGYSQRTSQDSLPEEPLPMESHSGAEGSEEASHQARSLCSDMVHPSIAPGAVLHDMEGLVATSCSHSNGSMEQILHNRGDAANFVDGVMELGSWEYDDQGQAHNQRLYIHICIRADGFR